MLTGLISLFTKDPKQKLADEFIKFIETGDNELLKNYQIQIGSKKFNQDGNGYLNFILKNKATKEKEHFSVGITPFLCNQESGNYGQVFACIREKQNGKHTNIKTYEVTDKMYKRIQKLISNVTSSRDSRFQNIEDFAETYLSLNDNYVYPIPPAPLTQQIISGGAFDVTNETATWINRQTNKTGEVSVFNATSIGTEPTAVSVEEPTAGMSETEITGWAAFGGLVLFLAGVGVKKLCDYYRSSSIYTLGTPEDQHYSDPEGQRQPLNPENTSGPRSSISESLTSLRSNSTDRETRF